MPQRSPADLVVVVDGPSGAGKSSAARQVAERLGMRYLDTGAMYRAVTWWLAERGVDVADADDVVAGLAEVEVAVGTDPLEPSIAVNGVDASAAIRTRDVTQAVSDVSAVPAVRRRMVEIQRHVLQAGGVVAEGRDLGTVVAPNADVKIFLTAESTARAERRHLESPENSGGSVTNTREDLQERDRRDSTRELSPLAMADDAVLIDSTHLSLDEVVDTIVSLVHDRAGADHQ